ncbi:flavin reductase family protein [Clostridium sp.]|uniref:flavin reductase family protein n=1 Tax=Clostridium sp. TaxID=1506 RepID=UPI001A418F32|nr:flavin reductase family protein [Clostridium sp.]MBK5236322.1 flavin reductase family protein [Clostridium sp.]
MCTTKNKDGTDHVAPFSWITPVSQKPPRVAMALLSKPNKQHSLENIERTGEFVVNLPDLNIAEKMVECSYSTKFGENKFDRSGFTRIPSAKVEPVGVGECRAHLECKVVSVQDAGDHALIIADVIHAQYDDKAFTPEMLINTTEYDPCIHIQSYNLNNSQLHLFMEPGGSYAVEVPYPTEINKDESEGGNCDK